MEIRLQGTIPELEEAEKRIRQTFAVKTVSRPYKNRRDELFRVYVEAEMRMDE